MEQDNQHHLHCCVPRLSQHGRLYIHQRSHRVVHTWASKESRTTGDSSQCCRVSRSLPHSLPLSSLLSSERSKHVVADIQSGPDPCIPRSNLLLDQQSRWKDSALAHRLDGQANLAKWRRHTYGWRVKRGRCIVCCTVVTFFWIWILVTL